MSSLSIAWIVFILWALMIWLLQVEKIVKLAFGSWLVLGMSLAIGIGIDQGVEVLKTNPEAVFLGINQGWFADFLFNAQPTIMLVISGLLLWFFVKYGQIRLGNGEDILQKILWSVLAMGSLVSMIWISLFTVGGGLYEWLFEQWNLVHYSAFFPLFVFVMALLSLIFASKVNIRFSVSTSAVE